MRGTWRPPGVTDFAVASEASAEDKATELSAGVLATIAYLREACGVALRVETFGLANIETGELVYEKRPRVVADNVPMSLLTGAEWGYLR
jgi:hypothetical protein